MLLQPKQLAKPHLLRTVHTACIDKQLHEAQNRMKSNTSLEACFVKVELFLTWLCVFKIQRLWCKTLEKQDNTMAEKKSFSHLEIVQYIDF